jgi:hypothetical protein
LNFFYKTKAPNQFGAFLICNKIKTTIAILTHTQLWVFSHFTVLKNWNVIIEEVVLIKFHFLLLGKTNLHNDFIVEHFANQIVCRHFLL